MSRNVPEHDSARLLQQLVQSGSVGDLEAAIQHDEIAKSDLQLYGIDWSQLESEARDTPLSEAFRRHGGLLTPTDTS